MSTTSLTNQVWDFLEKNNRKNKRSKFAYKNMNEDKFRRKLELENKVC